MRPASKREGTRELERSVAAARTPRRLPIGAEASENGTHFRLWAPGRRKVEVVVERSPPAVVELLVEPGGYFAAFAPGVRPGDRYRFRLDGDGAMLPDPASRFQPDGPHGPSEIIDPSGFAWTDGSWRGVERFGQILYEMHIGTFTHEGTWAAATAELAELARLGVTVLEIMPIADFNGQFGWGYDGVNWFAPTRLYGRPDDLRLFVDRAHALGLGVILDVVYNHFGPDGNYIARFTDQYESRAYATEWGAALNYDGENSFGVREFVVSNARYWIDEFHLDGLRLDATQSLFDASPTHIMTEIVAAVREAAGERSAYVVAENETQNASIARSTALGGSGIDGIWNDDYHHSAMVALTGRREAYYSDHRGTPQEFVSAVKWGFLYQGQYYSWQKKPRGSPALDLDPGTFVLFLQNHDQIANSGDGRRAHELGSPGKYRALTALTLLAPGTPMLFQGQEFAASAPFLYFADHGPELAQFVREGRRESLAQFPSLATPDVQKRLADPGLSSTFEACKLDFAERVAHASTYALHRDLLALRRGDAVLRNAQYRGAVDGFVLGHSAFGIRLFGGEAGDRLLLVNLAEQLDLAFIADPLFAPPAGSSWQRIWSSSDVVYGGEGTPDWEQERGVTLATESAIVLISNKS